MCLYRVRAAVWFTSSHHSTLFWLSRACYEGVMMPVEIESNPGPLVCITPHKCAPEWSSPRVIQNVWYRNHFQTCAITPLKNIMDIDIKAINYFFLPHPNYTRTTPCHALNKPSHTQTASSLDLKKPSHFLPHLNISQPHPNHTLSCPKQSRTLTTATSHSFMPWHTKSHTAPP